MEEKKSYLDTYLSFPYCIILDDYPYQFHHEARNEYKSLLAENERYKELVDSIKSSLRMVDVRGQLSEFVEYLSDVISEGLNNA